MIWFWAAGVDDTHILLESSSTIPFGGRHKPETETLNRNECIPQGTLWSMPERYGLDVSWPLDHR